MWVSKLNTILEARVTSSEYSETINFINTILLSVHKNPFSRYLNTQLLLSL